MRSSRSSTVAALTLIVAVMSGMSSSAHRRDEYLQAARLAIDPGGVRIELDLTPGISVAEAVLADIDVDRNAAISPAEMQVYGARVLEAIRLDVDGRPVAVQLTGSAFPSVNEVRRGEGTIRMQMQAVIPGLAAGVHHVRYANTHRPDIGTYLANALVPVSARIAITDQQRDIDQQRLDIAYVLYAQDLQSRRRSPILEVTGALVAVTVLWLAARRGSTGFNDGLR